MNEVVKNFIKNYTVCYSDAHCGAFSIGRKRFFNSRSNKEWGYHELSVKKAIKIINERGKDYYFFYAGFLPNEVIEYLREQTSDSAVRILEKDTLNFNQSAT